MTAHRYSKRSHRRTRRRWWQDGLTWILIGMGALVVLFLAAMVMPL